MPQTNPGERQPTEFNFESYVERQFCLINERLDEMHADIAGLSADVDTLATVIPQLATDLTATHEELTKKDEELTAAIAQEGADAATIARLEGEQAQVQAVKERLDPLVQQVSGLVTPPAGGDGGAPAEGAEAGAGEPPLPPPDAASKPLYTFEGGDPSTIDSAEWPKADVQTTDGRPLYTFSGDTAGEPPTGADRVWSVYEGGTEPVGSGAAGSGEGGV